MWSNIPYSGDFDVGISYDVLQNPVRTNVVAVNCFAVLAYFGVFLFTKLKFIQHDDLDSGLL